MSAVKSSKPRPQASLAPLKCCPECGNKNFIDDPDAGEAVCSNCGLVVNERVMNRGRDWRAYTQEQTNARAHVGPPTTLTRHDKNLSTYVGFVGSRSKDGSGRVLSPERSLDAKRLQRWQIRTARGSSADRNLSKAMTNIDRLTDVLHIPPVIKEKGAAVYRKMLEKDLLRGREIASMSAAALYAACRLSGNPRTLKEFAQCSQTKKKDLGRCYRLIVNSLEIKMPVSSPVTCIAKIATKVGISMQSQQHAAAILTQLQGTDVLRAKDPTGLAAATLYIACRLEGETATEKDLAAASGVTEVTIRNRKTSINEALGIGKRSQSDSPVVLTAENPESVRE